MESNIIKSSIFYLLVLLFSGCSNKIYTEFINEDKGQDTDIWALEHGYISIVPTQFDLTAHHAIKDINDWELS